VAAILYIALLYIPKICMPFYTRIYYVFSSLLQTQIFGFFSVTKLGQILRRRRRRVQILIKTTQQIWKVV
jgi:hypothetical protein